MGGIMVPITMSTGIERARTANREDERFEMDKEKHGLTMKGLELGNQQKGFEFEQAQKDAPLRDLERKAKTTSEMAKQAYVLLDQGHPEWGDVSDDQVGAYMAKVLTDIPVFGEAKLLPNGMLSDGKSTMRMDRQSALKLLAGLADPTKAMELARKEQQYINERGQVETMTAGEAKSRDLEMATDREAGYKLNKARVDDKFAEEKAGLDISKTRAEIGKLNAEALKTGRGGDYKFSTQGPDALREGFLKRTLESQGFTFDEAMKEWVGPGDEPVSREALSQAVGQADTALDLLSSGQASDPVQAWHMARGNRRGVGGDFGGDTPPVKGARRAKDGKWYVQTGTKANGKPQWAPVLVGN